MDLNLVVIAGRLACPPEVRTFDSDRQRIVRLLVTTVRETPRRRVDVIPVAMVEGADGIDDASNAMSGDRVWAVGRLQRRFWDGSEGRRSRIELVAESVTFSKKETVGAIGNRLDYIG